MSRTLPDRCPQGVAVAAALACVTPVMSRNTWAFAACFACRAAQLPAADVELERRAVLVGWR